MFVEIDGMYWHKDSDPNDGNNDHPIVSITIGNSCDFGIKLVGKPEQLIRLDSGDVIIWGGMQNRGGERKGQGEREMWE